ncbi:MAG TPA: MlaD family protein [Vicinamibacteria bacterium]|nr:MlaD family protein [Vicinamibacteria bacterium]
MSDGGTTIRRRQEEDGDELPPAPPARGASLVAWVGLFLVLGLVATLGALFIFTDAAIFRGRYIVSTNVADAGGIRRGDPVQMRGVNIGRVQRFRIEDDGVEIRLEIEGDYRIPKDSHVMLRSAGLLGGMVAEVVPGRAPETVGYGDTVEGRTEASLAGSTDEIARKADLALTRVNELLAPAMIQDVHGSTAELRQLLKQISTTVAQQQKELDTLTASLQRSASGLERVATAPALLASVERLDAVTQQMESVTTSLARSSSSMEAVMGRVQRGEGTLGKLAQDETLYNNLNQASVSLNQTVIETRKVTDEARNLLLQIQKDPRRYFNFSVF